MLSVSELAVGRVDILVTANQIKSYQPLFSTVKYSPELKNYLTHLINLRPKVKGVRPLIVNLIGVTDIKQVEPLMDLDCEFWFSRSSLLDPEVVNPHLFVVETDGTGAYGEEYLELAGKLYTNIKVTCTINPSCYSYSKFKSYIDQRVKDYVPEFSFNPNCLDFPIEQYRKEIDNLVNQAAQHIFDNNNPFAYEVIKPVLDRMNSDVVFYPNCQIGQRVLTLAMDGSRVICPRYWVKLGSSDYYENCNHINQLINYSMIEHPCPKCPVFSLCNGACPFNFEPKLCKVLKVFYNSIMNINSKIEGLKTEIEL